MLQKYKKKIECFAREFANKMILLLNFLYLDHQHHHHDVKEVKRFHFMRRKTFDSEAELNFSIYSLIINHLVELHAHTSVQIYRPLLSP